MNSNITGMAAVHPSAHDVGIPTTAPPSGVLNSVPYDTSLSQQQTPPHHHLHQTPTQGHAPTLQQQQQQSQQQRSVKRPRPVKSCTECRKRKLRCDRLCPCSQCQKSNRSCKYAMDHDSANLSDGSDSELMEPSRPTKRNCLPGMFTSSTPLPNNESTYGSVRNGETAAPSSLEELAMRMERLEKHLMARSPAASEASTGRLLAASSDTIRGLTVKSCAMRTRFHGQNSSRVLLNLVSKLSEELLRMC